MLLRTIFLMLLIALLSETIVHGAAALAHAALHQRALDAARASFVSGVQSAQAATANAIRENLDPRAQPLPNPLATCVASGTQGCEMTAQAIVTIPTPNPAGSPNACPQTNCTIYLQSNNDVQESRVIYRVSSVVKGPDGEILASRDADVAFRTFKSAPYASLVGSIDATLDALGQTGVSDDGGASPTTGANTTLITVEYLESGNPAATPMPGNVWQAQSQHPAALAPAWQP